MSHGLTDSIMNACRTATLDSLPSCVCCATEIRQSGKLCNGSQCERAAGELIAPSRDAVEPEEFDFQFKQLNAAGRLPGGHWQLIGSEKACRSFQACVGH
jgi:hypothetical protein